MAISFPYDILADFPGWSVDFDLMWRQEQSRTAGAATSKFWSSLRHLTPESVFCLSTALSGLSPSLASCNL